jgi:hypothetical protein
LWWASGLLVLLGFWVLFPVLVIGQLKELVKIGRAIVKQQGLDAEQQRHDARKLNEIRDALVAMRRYYEPSERGAGERGARRREDGGR